MEREYDPRANLELTGFTSPGIGGRYNAVRPRPPDELLDALTQYAKVDRPPLVVDVGCGTGLSTFVWSQRAERVIGVEPTARCARSQSSRCERPAYEMSSSATEPPETPT